MASLIFTLINCEYSEMYHTQHHIDEKAKVVAVAFRDVVLSVVVPPLTTDITNTLIHSSLQFALGMVH